MQEQWLNYAHALHKIIRIIISNNAPKSKAIINFVNIIAKCRKAITYRFDTLDFAFSVGGGTLSKGKHIQFLYLYNNIGIRYIWFLIFLIWNHWFSSLTFEFLS